MHSTRSIDGAPADTLQVLDTLEHLDSGFVALDVDDRYTYVNALAADLLGRSAEDLLGRCVWDVFPDGVGSPVHRAMERARTTGRTTIVEDYWESWDRWYEKRFYPHPGGLHISFTDITGRVRLEESLRGHADVAERLGLGLAVLRMDERTDTLRIASSNAALASIIGATPESLAGQIVDASHPLDLGMGLGDVCREVRSSGSSIDLGERTWVGPNGARTLRMRATPLNGRDVGLAIEDVTGFRTAIDERLGVATRLLGASETERHALGRGLTGPLEVLLATALHAGSAAATTPDETTRTDLSSIESALQSSVAALLELLADRYPPQLRESGLEAALPVLGAATGTRIVVRGEADIVGDVARDAAYRVVSEIARTAQTADELCVTLDADEHGSLSLTVTAPVGDVLDGALQSEAAGWVRLLGGTIDRGGDGDVISVHLPGAP